MAGRKAPKGAGAQWLEEALTSELPADGCLTWPFGRIGSGYAETWTEGRVRYVHHLVLERTAGPRPEGKQAAHSCGRGRDGCIDPRHLRWATAVENQADQVLHGKSNRGERSSSARLTRDDVQAIRLLFVEGVGTMEISRRYEIGPSTVVNIRYGRTWKWLD